MHKDRKRVLILKASGEKELFVPEKLFSSMVRAGASKELADKIVNHVWQELSDGMSTSEIYRHAFFLLHREEKPAASRYSIKRAIMELGPSGFAFEDYIAEIFRDKGYTAETDKVLRGACVDHEVDVVAYNENKLVMVEAKFHNQLGLKTDLKVVLYVKARFDDLRGVTFFFGKERVLDEGWLVTNTKFTSSAIQYGKCQKLKMIGWNYPAKGNLMDMIEDGDLEPITILNTIDRRQKEMILKTGLVLCKHLEKNSAILKNIGFNDQKIAEILNEVKNL